MPSIDNPRDNEPVSGLDTTPGFSPGLRRTVAVALLGLSPTLMGFRRSEEGGVSRAKSASEQLLVGPDRDPGAARGNLSATQEERAAWYRGLVQANGGRWRSGINRVNIVGLRGYDLESGPHANDTIGWNDTIAFVWRDKTGHMQVREFRCSTDPTIMDWPDAPDVNGDGKPDVATMRPGQYLYTLGAYNGIRGAAVPLARIPVYRNLDADPHLSAEEKRISIEKNYTASQIKIHWQKFYFSPAYHVPSSAGCTVIDRDQEDYMKEVRPILELNRGSMYYTLIDMSTEGRAE